MSKKNAKQNYANSVFQQFTSSLLITVLSKDKLSVIVTCCIDKGRTCTQTAREFYFLAKRGTVKTSGLFDFEHFAATCVQGMT